MSEASFSTADFPTAILEMNAPEKAVGDARAIYLYCFARAASTPFIKRLSEPVFEYPWEGVSAVCGWTRLKDWSGDEAAVRMRDVRWLTPKAMRHQAVIEAAMRNSPVLPARMGAVFSSFDSLEHFFAVHHQSIAGFLDEMENKDEWAVKVVVDRARLGQWMGSRIRGAHWGGAPSAHQAGYLAQRQARAAIGREVNHWVTQTLEPILEQLGRCAAASCRRESMPAAGGQPHPIFNLAFLVARENLDEFRRCARRATWNHRADGLELALSGPWPPYSFCPTLQMPL